VPQGRSGVASPSRQQTLSISEKMELTRWSYGTRAGKHGKVDQVLLKMRIAILSTDPTKKGKYKIAYLCQFLNECVQGSGALQAKSNPRNKTS